ncbi:MAG: hypothetical protein KGZ34_09610 [Nitrosarchaeum sp.]|nr:hypothetical protein [Nitrosarchaeum sp.]
MKYLVLFLVLIWFIGITQISYGEEFYESPNLIAVIEKENLLKSSFEYGDVIIVNGYVMENHGLTKVGNAKIIFSLMWPNNTKIVLEEKFANESGDFSLLIPISSNFIAGKYHLIAEPFWLGYQPTLESKKKILEFFVSPDKHDLIMSPLKQFKSGVRIDQIQCNEGFVVALKSSNGNPSCVKRESLEKLRERGWTEPLGDVVFQRTNPIKSESKTKSIITVQDRPINRTIVPITITEMTTDAQSLDTITYWNFSLLGIEMSTLNKYWGLLANQYITSEMVDQNGADVLDYSRIPDGMIFYKLSLFYYPATCEDGTKITGEGGYPEPIPIKKGIDSVFFKSGSNGLYPDDNGKYFFDFVSGFETDIEFHPNIHVISQETKKCKLDTDQRNFTDVYYTNAVFDFKE